MKTTMLNQLGQRQRRGWSLGWLLVLGLAASFLPFTSAQTVTTVGGGLTTINGPFNGYVDGNTLQAAQFNFPAGIALNNAATVLYVADRDNNAVRAVNLTGGVTTTFSTNAALNLPVSVSLDNVGNVYVLNQGSGTILKFNTSASLVATWTGLITPTAMTLDSSANIYVTELGGNVRRITNSTGGAVIPNSVLLSTGVLNAPRGIAIRDDGKIAISDSGNNCIRLIDTTNNNALTFLTLPNPAGSVDGVPAVASFNAPRNIAKAGNNMLIVADSSSHKVRTVDSFGNVTNLYGVNSANWQTGPYPAFLPGWADAVNAAAFPFAESRSPYGVVVDGGGNVFVTEVFYHIIRKVSGASIPGVGGTGSSGGGGLGTNTSPPSLSFTPNTGYFPMGQTISVSSSSAAVYYTTDGTEPTTNSLPVLMNGATGTILWKNPTNDLTFLKLKAYASETVFTNVGGIQAPNTVIGVPGSLNGPVMGGNGGSVVVPVVINLKTNARIRTINFNVEVTPNGGAPMITSEFQPLSFTTNDFIALTTSDSSSGGGATFNSLPYINPTNATSRGLVISFIGAAANYSISRFGAVALLRIPIPSNAVVGQTYTVSLRNPSATSDADETPVAIAPNADQTLLVTNISYTVGDTAQRGWYNAGDFGNGNINNNDVNNVFHASLGIRRPYAFTDAFNAMDVVPSDGDVLPGEVGGDRKIEFIDWQEVLRRASRLEPNNYIRARSSSGALTNNATTLNGQPNTPATTLAFQPGNIWNRQALIGAVPVENVSPGVEINVPIYVRVAPGAVLSGLQFRAAVVADGGAPAVTSVQYVAAPGVQPPAYSATGISANEIGVGWSLGNFNYPGPSSNVIGYLRFTVPLTALTGQHYTITFQYPGGGTGSLGGVVSTLQSYDLETRSGYVWVGTSAGSAPGLITDEWKVNFFGTTTNPDAYPNADPDGDGIPNWQEFLAGTNPTNAQSKLVIGSPENRAGNQVAFQLLTAPSKLYVLEYTENLFSGSWTVVSTNLGDGTVQEFIQTNNAGGRRFYRVRLLP